MASTAFPETTSSGTHEVVRRWTPDGPTRATVVICHGLGEHSGRYEHTGDLLAEAGLAVVAYDQVGFGGSGGRRAWVDQWSDVLDQIQRHVQEAKATGMPAILFGCSNGGLFALEYTISERPTPDLLVMSAPALGGGAAWQRRVSEIVDRVFPKARIPNNFKSDQLSRDPAVGDAYFEDPLNVFATTVHYGTELFRAMDRVRREATRLTVPTLVLHGASDTIVPPQSTAFLADLPGVERRVFPALRHELLNEPEGPEIIRDVVTWIDRHLS